MLDLQSTIGIVLQTIPYREYDKIISLFSPEGGIVKLFVKGSFHNKNIQPSALAPLVKGEYCFKTTRSLARLEEASLIASHAFLRNSLTNLESAFKLAQAILKSQPEGKKAPELFLLFASYLENLSLSPLTLASSFLLKVLKYEGLWQFEPSCYGCKTKVDKTVRLGGMIFCSSCAPKEGLFFSQEEEKELFFLANSRSLHDICQFDISEEMQKKINLLFEYALHD